jgi:hypothetical protein
MPLCRRAALLGTLLASSLRGQEQPLLRVDLGGTDPPQALVSVRHLLSEQRFLQALESGFPLYVEYKVALKRTGSLRDRTVGDPMVWEYVVLFDPVRERFTVETPDGTESLPDREALRTRVARVYRVPLEPDRPGEYYCQVQATARTLSDQDVDETFAWLKGQRGGPGLLDRIARRVLVELAPLPRLKLSERSATFAWR